MADIFFAFSEHIFHIYCQHYSERFIFDIAVTWECYISEERRSWVPVQIIRMQTHKCIKTERIWFSFIMSKYSWSLMVRGEFANAEIRHSITEL